MSITQITLVRALRNAPVQAITPGAFSILGKGVPGDLNGDGMVDPADLAIVLGNWGPCKLPPDECLADLDGDGIVGPADLAIVLGNWRPC